MSGEKAVAKPEEPYWLVYLALFLAGLLMLAEAIQYYPATRWTAKLAATLLFSAFALWVANGKFPGKLAVAIVWLAAAASWVI